MDWMSTIECATCQQALVISTEITINAEEGSQLVRCSHCGVFTTVPPESARPLEK